MQYNQEELKKKIDAINTKMNLPAKKEEVETLEKQTYELTFWHDQKKATEVMKKITALKHEIDEVEMMQLYFEDQDFKEAGT